MRHRVLVPASFRAACACLALCAGALGAAEPVAALDPLLGVPRLLWGPAAREPLNTSMLRKPLELEVVARQRLAEIAPRYRLADARLAAVETLEVRAEGARQVRFGQRFGAWPVLERELVLTLDGRGGLLLASGNLSPDAPATGFALEPRAAFERAWRLALGADDATPAPTLAPIGAADDWTTLTALAHAPGRWRLAEARLRRGWLHDGSGLRPVFDFELTLQDGEGLRMPLALKVDGADGRALGRRALDRAAAHQYRAWIGASAPFAAQSGPQGDSFSPHPTGVPDGSALVAVARGLRTVDATAFRSDQRPWLADAGSDTRDGHQVVAYADVDGGGDGTGGEVTAASVGGAFDFAFDPALDHDASDDQLKATLVHAFYVLNDIADWFYAAGFDEAGGNHQQNNFGRGGLGGDPLILETGDGDVASNAFASVPGDGASPRISMGVFVGDVSRTLTIDGDAGTDFSRGGADVGTADFGPRDFDLTDDLVTASDGAGIDPLDLCEPPTDPAAVAGKIVLVKRGNCLFNEKAMVLQNAGAVGMLVHNHTAIGQPNGGVLQMGGSNPAVTIPSMLITLEDGQALRTALGAGEAFSARFERDGSATVDSAADSSIVAHEWGHVLVNRHFDTPGPDAPGSGCGFSCYGPQPSGLNEGFADFVALLYLVDGSGATPGFAGAYGVGQWAVGSGTPDGAYFGFRRYPYSTDLTKNPLMFRHLAASASLPGGVPNGDPSADPTEVHAVGELIAATLWDAYVAMLNSGRYTQVAARDRMRDYVAAAFRAMPNAPTFLEARDTFYAVVLARSRDDHALFTAAFARRGMGLGAVGPAVGNLTNSGIVESFAVEPTPLGGGGGGGGGGESGALVVGLLMLAGARRSWARRRRARRAD